jgi:hypothetical protein
MSNKTRIFTVMDRSGDTQTTFAIDKDGTSKAMERFNQLVNEHRHMAYARADDGSTRLLREFDPNASEIIFHPQRMGG